MRHLSGPSSAGILLSMGETDSMATRRLHGTERWLGLLAYVGHLISPKSAFSAAHFASRKAHALPRVLHTFAGTAGERPRQRTLL